MHDLNRLYFKIILTFIIFLVSTIVSGNEIQVSFVTGDVLSNNRPIKIGDTVRLKDRINLPKKAFLVLKFNLGNFDKEEWSVECIRRVFIQGEISYVVEKEETKNECSEATKWNNGSLRQLESGGSFLYKKTYLFVVSENSDNFDPLAYRYFSILKEKERNSLSETSPVTPPKHPPSAPTKPLPPASTQNPDNSSQLTYPQALELYNSGLYSHVGISMVAPDTVENSLVVPISVSTNISNNQKLWVSFNNQHLAMTKNVSSKTLVSFKVRLKINKPGAILVMAQDNDHIRAKAQQISIVNKQLRYSNQKPVQLNSWIKKLDRLKAAKSVSMSTKLRAKHRGNKLTIKLIIKHPTKENDFIEAIGMYLNNKPLSYTKFTPEVSQNPYLSMAFEGIGKPGDVLKVVWVDNHGKFGLKSLVIAQ